MNLKFESIVQIFRKIIQLNAVNILKSTNEYYRQKLSKKVAAKWTFILLCSAPKTYFVSFKSSIGSQLGVNIKRNLLVGPILKQYHIRFHNRSV